jgi:hypothetical protein
MRPLKFFWRSLLFVAAFACAGRAGYSQSVDTVVEVPTTAHRSALIEIPTAQNPTGNPDNTVTLAGEYKSTKNVVEEQKPVCWNWYADFGYVSQYNFRGTNLTPGADGAVYADAAVSKWGFTLGFFDIYQLGTARFPSFSAGEGGGGGSGGSVGRVGTYAPETVQARFNEIDVFLQYHRAFGPVEVTAGNIWFFIDRDAQTFLDTEFFGLYGPFPTVQNEQFDRIFVRLSTSAIPHIQPWITYYQTLLSDGEDHRFYRAPRIPPDPLFPPFLRYGTPRNNNYHERNDELGGYLEGRLRGNFPVGEWIDFNPFGVISYSYHDRSEPVGTAPPPGQVDTRKFKDILRGRSLVGWNNSLIPHSGKFRRAMCAARSSRGFRAWFYLLVSHLETYCRHGSRRGFRRREDCVDVLVNRVETQRYCFSRLVRRATKGRRQNSDNMNRGKNRSVSRTASSSENDG